MIDTPPSTDYAYIRSRAVVNYRTPGASNHMRKARRRYKRVARRRVRNEWDEDEKFFAIAVGCAACGNDEEAEAIKGGTSNE